MSDIKGCKDLEAHGHWAYIDVVPGDQGQGEQTERCLMCDMEAARQAQIKAEEALTESEEGVAAQSERIISLENALKQKEQELDEEIGRWQKAIYKLCCASVGKDNESLIDGGGTDSGDPLDFTLSEISQTINYWCNKLDEKMLMYANASGIVGVVDGEIKSIRAERDQFLEELNWFRQSLSIIAGAPDSLKAYNEQFHVALCRCIARETLVGCRMDRNEKGIIIYIYIPEELIKKDRELEEEAWKRSE